jgi:hypothetical protein
VQAFSRARRLLAGSDTTTRAGLPCNELLAPLPLFALGLLVLNDRVLKGSSLPELLTGKLSDFAGVFVLPLVMTAVFDLVLAGIARAGVLVDYTLRRWKLAVAIAFTGIVFAAMKLSPAIGGWVEALWSKLVPSSIYPDPTDAIAVIVLAATWWHGRRTIARGAYGRLWLARRKQLARPFADAAACGADPQAAEALDAAVADWIAGGPPAPVDTALAQLRD